MRSVISFIINLYLTLLNSKIFFAKIFRQNFSRTKHLEFIVEALATALSWADTQGPDCFLGQCAKRSERAGIFVTLYFYVLRDGFHACRGINLKLSILLSVRCSSLSSLQEFKHGNKQYG